MRNRPAPLLLGLALPLLLTACGKITAGADAPDRADLEARAAALQTRTEHVYVTEADGFALAEQSVGVLGDDGFSAAYVAKSGATITLSVERGGVDAAACARIAAGGSGATVDVPCEEEGGRWYLVTEHGHAYLRAENGLRVRVGADRSVDRATLRGAAERTHRASDQELDAVLPELGPGAGAPGGGDGPSSGDGGPPARDGGLPVERGDLPPEGDGAPQNDVGTSG